MSIQWWKYMNGCITYMLGIAIGIGGSNNMLSPFSMERVLERFRRRLCMRVFRAEHALLLKKNASTMNIAHVSMGADCRAD